MPPSLRSFLDGLVDYAGLFPPATLDLDTALRNYAGYRTGADAWMLGRFVVPVARLDGLDAYEELFVEGPPFRFAVLTRPPDPASGTGTEGLLAALAAARRFEERHDGRVVADVFEAKWSGEPGGSGAALDEALGAFGEAAGPADRLFVEVGLGGDGLEAAARALADHNERAGRAAAGLKLRCGGTAAAAFPGVEAVARAVVAARDAGVPLKATAGLHHPVRRWAPDVRATMHGFVNVFGAAVLAHARRLDAAAVGRVLAEERPERFVFDADGFAWNGYGATPAEVKAARAAFATGFGSCSFDEPREDLRALGWL